MNGIVFDIKEFAVFDGPGIRTTVFMKGCPLHCQWCHNPEGISPRPQLMVSKAACIHCGACRQVCQHPEQCIHCGACVPYCKGGFRKIVGANWDSEALARRLIRDQDVYILSGGGVTFSGGEPLLQWAFVADTMKQLPGVHKAIETSGYATDSVFEEAMALSDLIMMDWKVSDPALHLHYTGVEQDVILRHVRTLSHGSTPFILRMPIIPGVNDNVEHFEFAANLVKNASSFLRLDVLPYQRTAGAKYEMVDKKYCPEFDETQRPCIHTEVFDALGVPYQLFR